MRTFVCILPLIFITCLAQAQGAIDTYSELPFNGSKYDVFVIKTDAYEVGKFNILQNDSLLQHDAFLNKLLQTDSMVFLINASISDTLCRPIGYYTKNAQSIQPANMKSGLGNFYLKPNGAILFTKDDVVICESADIYKYQQVRLGVQSGPLLLNNGAVHPGFDAASQNKNIRCGVGLFYNNNHEKFLAFALSTNPVSFYEFAMFFNKRFKCDTALCLESAGCAMYFPNQASPGKVNPTICNYICYRY